MRPFLEGGGALKHPSVTNTYELHNNSTIGSLTQIIGNRAVNELRAGYADSWDRRDNPLNDPFTVSLLPTNVEGNRVMCMRFLGGYQIGTCAASPTNFANNVWSFRDQFNYTFQKGRGSHTLKAGGEALIHKTTQGSCGVCYGIMDLSAGPVPANLPGAVSGVERPLDMEEECAGAGADRQALRMDHRRSGPVRCVDPTMRRGCRTTGRFRRV